MNFLILVKIFIILYSTSSCLVFANNNVNQEAELEFTKNEPCIMNKNCFLPKCNCESTRAPADLGHYRRDSIPQLVVLSIDEELLDKQSYRVYKKLFEGFKNPNNQSIRATFFLSDSQFETDFCLVRNIYEQRHEIAISTINYTCPHKQCNVKGPSFRPWKYDTWLEQVLGMRERLVKYSGIPKSDIIGFRAPLLEPASDMHYRILAGNKFLYDSSLIVSSENRSQMVWPYTLDYQPDLMYPIDNNGPLDTYKGMWELPVPILIGYDDKQLTCSKMWDSWCGIDNSVRGISKFLRSHFLRSYYNNRAPVMLHINANWLKHYETVTDIEILPNLGYVDARKRKVEHERKEYRNLDGLIKFINTTLTNNKEVYFVTARQAIEWIKLMPILGRKLVDLKQFIDEELLRGPFSNADEENQAKFDGKCTQITNPLDLTSEEHSPFADMLVQDEGDLTLDDAYGLEPKELKNTKLNKTVLIDLQSEVLFINEVVIYMVIALAFLCIVIIVYDRNCNSRK